MSISREERESTLRFDATDAPASLYTADPRVAARWEKLGITLTIERQGTDDIPTGWKGECPKAGVKLRKLVDGVIVKRVVDPSRAQHLRRKPILP